MKEENSLAHYGVLGMRWGRRSGSSKTSGGGGKRRFNPKSLTTKMDGRKTNKLFGKRNRKAIGKAIVNSLMTPRNSKVKWTDMSAKQKKKTLITTAALVGALGVVHVGGNYLLKRSG